jgi:hypothetical protein
MGQTHSGVDTSRLVGQLEDAGTLTSGARRPGDEHEF